jgi:hypothetical protein
VLSVSSKAVFNSGRFSTFSRKHNSRKIFFTVSFNPKNDDDRRHALRS